MTTEQDMTLEQARRILMSRVGRGICSNPASRMPECERGHCLCAEDLDDAMDLVCDALTASEKPRIMVGSFVLTTCEDSDFIGIAHESGEAGTFKTANLEQALFKFFGEQF